MPELPSYLMTAPDGVPWLTFLLLSPLVGMLLVGLAGILRLDERTVRLGVTSWMFVSIGLAVVVAAQFNPLLVSEGQGVVQLVEQVPWIRSVKVEYFLGVDGISLPMVLLTVLMAPVAALAVPAITERVRLYYALLLLLETAMLGYFLALDFFFFFVFWEFSLVPAFFLILLWGGSERRNAAFQFFVYTVSGSLGLLLLFQFIYLAVREAGIATFDLIELGRLGQGLPVGDITASLREGLFNYADTLGMTGVLGSDPLIYTGIAFWAIFIAFAVKLAVWPFHTWLPQTYAEAPNGGSILLSAVMSKMGAYGMLRILLPFVPDAAQFFAPAMGALALMGIVTGAYGALSYIQGDIKRLIAYTSINHMGYVMLGIGAVAASGAWASVDDAAILDSRAMAMNGALMQMVAHGLSTGALFLLAGMLYQRTGSYNLSDFGGLRTVIPGFAGVLGMAMFANLGLPGLAGFVGEFFIFRGAWATLPLWTLLATIGLVITALALLRMFQYLFLGPLNPRWSGSDRPADIRPTEFWIAAPLLALLLVLGVYPALVMNLTNAAVTGVVEVFARLPG